jgi:alkanesulfonate monooxygenase SsuD/methylene tetrahydromethanopterin reductase-like flavin-dependent oxidoreductase (luciferase family)
VHISPTSDVPQPIRPEIPIWIAGVNKLMLRTAGELADGLVGHPMFTAEYVRGPVADEIAVGAAVSGRDPAEVTIMGIRMCAINDDVELARRQVAYAIGQYAASRVYDRLFELHGWSAAQQRIRRAARDRDDEAVIGAVTDDMIDTIAIACRPAEFSAALAGLPEGFDHLDLIAPPWGLSDRETRAINTRILAGLRVHLASAMPV